LDTQIKKGLLDLCVLSFLIDKDMYGYEIVQSISKSIEVSEGTIYPILRRLSKEGYFETYIEFIYKIVYYIKVYSGYRFPF